MRGHNQIEPGSSAYVYGRMPNRAEVIEEFRRGRFSRIFNSQVLSHGFDDPDVEVVTLTAPSKSVPAITQKIGRGTRVLTGVLDGYENCKSARVDFIAASAKPYLEVLDMIGNAGVHKTVDEFDILGGEYGSDVVSMARRTSKGSVVDVKQALIEAREAVRVQADSRRHHAASRDPFDVSRSEVRKVSKPPTIKMVSLLSRYGYDANKLSFNQARMMIGMLAANEWKGIPTPPRFAERARCGR